MTGIYAHAAASVALAAAVTGGAAVLEQTTTPTAAAGPTVQLDLDGRGLCAGVHIGGGYILTAAHCFFDPEDKPVAKVHVIAEGGVPRDTEILWTNRASDVALARTNGDHLQAAGVSCSDPLTIGEELRGVGHPMRVYHVSTWGRVAGVRRPEDPWRVAVPVDLSMNPGDSGGPVFNQGGEVVGIMVGGVPGPGGSVNFIVPASELCRLTGRAA